MNIGPTNLTEVLSLVIPYALVLILFVYFEMLNKQVLSLYNNLILEITQPEITKLVKELRHHKMCKQREIKNFLKQFNKFRKILWQLLSEYNGDIDDCLIGDNSEYSLKFCGTYIMIRNMKEGLDHTNITISYDRDEDYAQRNMDQLILLLKYEDVIINHITKAIRQDISTPHENY